MVSAVAAAIAAIAATVSAIAVAAAIAYAVATVSVAAVAAAVAMAPAPAVPGTYAEEDAVIKPLRTVVPVGSAGVGGVVVIAVLANGRAGGIPSNADADGDLGVGGGCGSHEEADDRE
jgi:hypothetical protein